jgi:hypothetical protein
MEAPVSTYASVELSREHFASYADDGPVDVAYDMAIAPGEEIRLIVEDGVVARVYLTREQATALADALTSAVAASLRLATLSSNSR